MDIINSKLFQFKNELEDLGWNTEKGIENSVVYRSIEKKETITFIPEFSQIEYWQVNDDGLNNIFRLKYSEILEINELLPLVREFSNKEIEKFKNQTTVSS